MYQGVRIRLTLFYSALFFLLIWSLSLGLYFWMSQSFGQGYITQVRQLHGQAEADTFEQHVRVVTIAGGVALNQLKYILLIFNGLLLLVVPMGGWFLTSKTLAPVERVFEQQRQFISDASHELRTPLSIISGEMQVALKKDRTPQEYKEVIRTSKEEMERLTRLVENLLYLARSDRDNARVKFQSLDVTDLLVSLVADFNPKIKAKSLKVRFEPPDKNLMVRGHPAMLWTLFANLLDNAIKYTPEKGQIRVKITNQNDQVAVEIKDNGMGIDLKKQGKIFDRFYRVDASRSRPKGFGLGLSISKSIVQWHRGKIMVNSIPGKGTSFMVYLPKLKSQNLS